MKRRFLFFYLFVFVLFFSFVSSNIPSSGPCPEACMYFDDEIGLETCVYADEHYIEKLGRLYYLVYDNKSYENFGTKYYEMTEFNYHYFNNAYFNAKIVKFYEDGRKETIYNYTGGYSDYYPINISTIEEDKWNFKILESNKGLLTKDDLNVNFDLSHQNSIKSKYFEFYDMVTDKQLPNTITLLDIFLDKRKDSYNAVFLNQDLQSYRKPFYSDRFEIFSINSINNREHSSFNLNVIDKNDIEFVLNDGRIHFEYKSPFIYLDETDENRFLISLKDYYLDGNMSENYAEIIFIQYKMPSIDGIYKIVRCYDDKLDIKMYTPEELSYLINVSDRSLYSYHRCGENQCSMDGNCYEVGYREGRKYCSDERYNFISQKSKGEHCDNNFECSSNLCSNGKCANTSLNQPLEFIVDYSNITKDQNTINFFDSYNTCPEHCKYSDYEIGLEKCIDVDGDFRGISRVLYYFVYDNKTYRIFNNSGIHEMFAFNRGNFDYTDFKVKMIKVYEDGKNEITTEYPNYNDNSQNISLEDEWVFQSLRSNTKGLLTKNDLEIEFDLTNKSLIKIKDLVYYEDSEPRSVKLALLDIFLNKKKSTYKAIFFGEDQENGEGIGFNDIDSADNDDDLALNVFNKNTVELTLGENTFKFDYKFPFIYKDETDKNRLLIDLKDYYLDGDESENYVEIVSLEYEFKSLSGIYHVVSCYNDVTHHKTYSPEELNFLSEENAFGLNTACNPNQCGMGQKCYEVGFRRDHIYCSDERYNFVSQKGEGEFCDNNFECDSNLCLDRECIGTSFLQKVLNWFRNLFSSDKD